MRQVAMLGFFAIAGGGLFLTLVLMDAFNLHSDTEMVALLGSLAFVVIGIGLMAWSFAKKDSEDRQ